MRHAKCWCGDLCASSGRDEAVLAIRRSDAQALAARWHEVAELMPTVRSGAYATCADQLEALCQGAVTQRSDNEVYNPMTGKTEKHGR